MSARVQWDGLEAFLRQFGSIPKALHDDGMAIIVEETEGAAVEITRLYHRVTGRLARRVRTSYPSSTILVGIAQSTAPHAHLYEFGTKVRQTSKGYNRGRMWGTDRTTDHAVTVPIARRRRARMARRMVDMLRSKGFAIGGAE